MGEHLAYTYCNSSVSIWDPYSRSLYLGQHPASGTACTTSSKCYTEQWTNTNECKLSTRKRIRTSLKGYSVKHKLTFLLTWILCPGVCWTDVTSILQWTESINKNSHAQHCDDLCLCSIYEVIKKIVFLHFYCLIYREDCPCPSEVII